jgi:hypothetical protein
VVGVVEMVGASASQSPRSSLGIATHGFPVTA